MTNAENCLKAICDNLLEYTNNFQVGKRVNEILSADIDPVGVAAWWVQVNGYLQERPISFLGEIAEWTLVQLAEGTANGD